LLHGADHWADELDFENLVRLAADEPVPDTSSDNQTRSDAPTVEIPDFLADFGPFFAPPAAEQFGAASSTAAFDPVSRVHPHSPIAEQIGQAHSPGPPWSPSPFDGIGVSGLHTTANATHSEVSTYLMCKMTENLNLITQELASMKSGGAGHRASLASIPKGEGSRPLPSAKAWRSWTALKLLPWCGLQVDGFAEALQNVLSRDVSVEFVLKNPRFAKANKMLAYELGSMIDEDIAPYITDVDKTNGLALILSLSRVVSTTSASYATTLHERFSQPLPIKDKASLHHALKLWRSDYDELKEADCMPSKATTLQSLRRLVSSVDDLKVPLEVLQMTKPDDHRAIYLLSERKAAEWAILAADVRTSGSASIPPHSRTDVSTAQLAGFGATQPTPKGYTRVGKGSQPNGSYVPCSFFLTGHCQFGNDCNFLHPASTTADPTAAQHQSEQRLHQDVCRICFETGHWGNECPLKGQGKGKHIGKGQGKGNWIGASPKGNMENWIGSGIGSQPQNHASWGNWAGTNSKGSTGNWIGAKGNGMGPSTKGSGSWMGPSPKGGGNWMGSGSKVSESPGNWTGANPQDQPVPAAPQGDPWTQGGDPWSSSSESNIDSRKRNRVNNASAIASAPPEPTSIEEELRQYLNQQKQAYKDVKTLMEKVSGAMIRVRRILAPGLILEAGGAAASTLRMVGDTGAERHVICGKDFGFVRNRRPLRDPIILETANGETLITEAGDVTCAGIDLLDCLLCTTASSSLLATIMLTDNGWKYSQDSTGARLLGPDLVDLPFTREGNLFILSDKPAARFTPHFSRHPDHQYRPRGRYRRKNR
jgi:hypothetical protein